MSLRLVQIYAYVLNNYQQVHNTYKTYNLVLQDCYLAISHCLHWKL